MKISIITPSFNSGKYLERAIESVLKQDCKDFEHIVIDGGSKDETVEILKSYPHIKWLTEPDKGQSDAMNKGFKMAKGDIIGYLNADDCYHPNIFGSVMDQFQSSSEEMVVGDIIIQSAKGTEKRTPTTNYLEVIDFVKDLFPANPVSYFYNRKVQLAFGDFPIENQQTMDLDFIFYAYKYFNVKYIPIEMGTFYLDGENKTSVMNVRDEQRKALFKFLWKHDRRLYYQKKIQELVFNTKKTIKNNLVS